MRMSRDNRQANDELKNRRLCGGDTFVVRLEGPSAVNGSVKDHGDGTYTATYQACVAGTYTLGVTNGQFNTKNPPIHGLDLGAIMEPTQTLACCVSCQMWQSFSAHTRSTADSRHGRGGMSRQTGCGIAASRKPT